MPIVTIERSQRPTRRATSLALLAPVIALLEEQRHDNPMLPSRIDREADTMATATDPRQSLEQLEADQHRLIESR